MELDLTRGSVLKNVVRFSLPYLLSYFLQTLYGMADLFIIGQYAGVEATTAVSVGSQVMHMLTVMLVGLAMGTSEAVGYILLRDVKRVPYEELYLDPDKLAKEFDAAHPAAIVENDCVIVTGESLLQAFDRLEVMELTAASILKSQRLGRMVHISDEEVAALKETYHLEG